MHPRSALPHPHSRARRALLVAVWAVLSAVPAMADPVVGFVETFSSPGVGSWGGGGASGLVISNPGTGGTGGAGDGYLLASLGSPGNFGVRSTGAEYAGDWVAAGVLQLRLSLQDVGAPNAFQIHVCLGNTSNFWETNTGFLPPAGTWQEFVVDLTNEANFTRIIGSGTFTEALQHVDRLLIRHDLPPLTMSPDATSGDLGIDHISLEGGATRTIPSTWGRIQALYR